jgi:hypothetical protein
MALSFFSDIAPASECEHVAPQNGYNPGSKACPVSFCGDLTAGMFAMLANSLVELR